MAPSLADLISEQVEQASKFYHRLVVVAGPSRSGKTSALRILQHERGWPLLNINLALSERLLELSVKQRALRVARIVDELVQGPGPDIALLDNIEILFHPDLQLEPLRLLQAISRNRTVVVTWRGAHHGNSLTYAVPDHPEFRRFEEPQALIVSSAGIPTTRGATSAQERSE